MTPPASSFHARFLELLKTRHDAGGPRLDDQPAWSTAPAFEVYVNTGLRACIEALESNYPSVVNWLTTPWFRPLAAAYARTHPPTDSRLFLYGDGLSSFLSAFEPCSEWPYLSELAILDRLWTESHAAADSTPLDAVRLASDLQSCEALAYLRPAPSTRWHFSHVMPVWDLWITARRNDSLRLSVPWEAQGILITRPGDAVLTHQLDACGHAFLSACALGHPLPLAAEAALSIRPDCELQPLLTMLFSQGAFTEHSLSINQKSTDKHELEPQDIDDFPGR